MDDNIEAKILNEKSPFMREIWSFGYSEVQKSNVDIVLIDKNRNYRKTIDFVDLIPNFTVITRMDSFGNKHSWLSDEDGSAERFREIIKPT